MARTRSSVATKPVTTTAPLQGCVISLCGRFNEHGHSQASLEKLVVSLGGTITKSIARSTTHLVCTREEYLNRADKVGIAKRLKLFILSPSWLVDLEAGKSITSCHGYRWRGSYSPDSTMKRPPASLADHEADEPQTKKSKQADGLNDTAGPSFAPAQAPSAGSAVLDKARQNLEERQTKGQAANQVNDTSAGESSKKKDTTIPVDSECSLSHQGYTVFIEPAGGMIYDTSLNQTNSSKNANKFYLIQILVSSDTRVFKTWTRWGRVGESGQNALLGDGSLPDAIKHFEKKFKDKSGLAWDQRTEPPKPGKYAFVEKSYGEDDDDDNSVDQMEDGQHVEVQEAPVSSLPPAVQSLMELIFNPDLFQAAMSALNYNANKLPLGKLSKGNILRGYGMLTDLAAVLDDNALAHTRWDMPLPRCIEHLSNTYYSLIPHAFGRRHPPVINTKFLVNREVDLLESLTDMKVADEMMKTLRPGRDASLADKQFAGLCLEEMTVLDQSSTEFQILESYLRDSRGQTHNSVSYKIIDIFRIERHGERNRFEDYVQNSKIGANRRLLWHGSRVANFGGILSQGLRIAPPEAPAHGTMFGKGIYLADMSSKSAGYCSTYSSGRQGLLLLCEAKLGDPIQELAQANYRAAEEALSKGMESTHGMGTFVPKAWMDAGVIHPSLKGVQMPDTNVGPVQVEGHFGLHYNEYICYNVAQVRLRYLFRCEF